MKVTGEETIQKRQRLFHQTTFEYCYQATLCKCCWTLNTDVWTPMILCFLCFGGKKSQTNFDANKTFLPVFKFQVINPLVH